MKLKNLIENSKEESAVEKFKEINAAYEVLSDPEKKAQYDQFGDQCLVDRISMILHRDRVGV